MKYYIAVNQTPVGPFSVEELMERGIKPSDLIWAEGMSGWTPAANIPEIASALGAPGCPAVPPEVTTTAPVYEYPSGPQQQYPACPPKSWLVESILATILCCLPFGIVAIVKASKVNSLWQIGNYDGAYAAAAEAKKWIMLAFICGLVFTIIYIIFVVFAAIYG